jgi:hypothetical protein
VLALEEGVAAEEIDGTMFGCGHEPCAGIGWGFGLRPLFQRGDEGFLGEIFGEADVAGEAREARDEAGGFDSPDSIDCAM